MRAVEKDIHTEKQSSNKKWRWVFGNTFLFSSYLTAIFTIIYSFISWFWFGSFYPAFVSIFISFPSFFICIFLGSLWDWSKKMEKNRRNDINKN